MAVTEIPTIAERLQARIDDEPVMGREATYVMVSKTLLKEIQAKMGLLVALNAYYESEIERLKGEHGTQKES